MIRTGKVKFWHDVKEYAFIVDNENQKEYYTYKKLLSDGETRLVAGEMVEFDTKETNKGTHAINVRSIQ